MTKTVRIENADMSEYRVLVQVWQKGQDSTEAHPGSPDTLVREVLLSHPTAMEALGVTDRQYLVVKEA